MKLFEVLGDGLKSKVSSQDDLNIYDFDNAILEKECPNGTKRIPLDLFDNYEIQINEQVNQKPDYSSFRLKTGHSISMLNLPLNLYTKQELVFICLMKFESMGLVEVLRTDVETLQRLIEELAKRYLKNPYHNFTHAVCLMHILYWIISQIEYSKFFS